MGTTNMDMEKEAKPIEDRKKRERSSAYPSIGLEQSLNLNAKLRGKLGKGPYDRESVALALGYSGVTGVSATKIAALRQFGLLGWENKKYRQTELADKIHVPINEEEKRVSIIEAVKSPKLYSSLIERFSGSKLPGMLNNILSRDFGINIAVATGLAENIIESLKFAGVIDENETIKTDSLTVNQSDEDGQEKVCTTDQENNNYKSESESTEYSIAYLPSGIKVLFPSKLRIQYSMGEFIPEIKAIQEKAKIVLKPDSAEQSSKECDENSRPSQI